MQLLLLSAVCNLKRSMPTQAARIASLPAEEEVPQTDGRLIHKQSALSESVAIFVLRDGQPVSLA